MSKNKIFNKKNIITVLGIISAYILLSVLVEFKILNRQYTSLIVPIGVNIMLAVSLNLVTGYLGELSLGHAGFMAIGVYSSAIFTLNSNLPWYIEFPIAIIIGGVFASIFGLLIGIPVLRLKGDYLAIVTLGFGEIVKSIINTLSFPAGLESDGTRKMIKGTMGLSGIEKHSNYSWIFFATVITIIIIVNLVNSRFGRIMSSIRDNDIAAESVGINVSKYKVITFAIAAFFAGVAGVIYVHNFSTIRPTEFDYNRSISILVFVVLGGMGSIKGSIIAAILLTLLPEVLRVASQYRMIIYALLLIFMMIFNNSELKEKFKIKKA